MIKTLATPLASEYDKEMQQSHNTRHGMGETQNIPKLQQTDKTLVKCHIMWHLIWVFSVCSCYYPHAFFLKK